LRAPDGDLSRLKLETVLAAVDRHIPGSLLA
jgi:hypothetical protein